MLEMLGQYLKGKLYNVANVQFVKKNNATGSQLRCLDILSDHCEICTPTFPEALQNFTSEGQRSHQLFPHRNQKCFSS